MTQDHSDAAQMRAFLARWKEAGPLLEAERGLRLTTLSDDAARERTLELFSFWKKPAWDPRGEELVAQQDLFARYRSRAGFDDVERKVNRVLRSPSSE